MNKVVRVFKSYSTYPISTVYLAGVIVAVFISLGWVSLGTGLLILTLAAVIVLLITQSIELRRQTKEILTVHLLVNSQRDELLNRISDLVDTLENAGIALPDREQEKESKDVTAEHRAN